MLIPLVGSFFVVKLVAPLLFRPDGWVGLVAWLVQAMLIGVVTSTLLDKAARRLLPLATLFNMSLVFPDQAPSRFSVALRSGSVKQLTARLEADGDDGGHLTLGETEGEASARALEYVGALSKHDRLTRGHTERVRAYADLIAVEMGLSEDERAKLAWGVLLHDVGKMAVPSEVLNKVEKLTDEEWECLRGHPAAGQRLLEPLSDWLGPWANAAGEHHERWDGGGYPNGLAGEEISLAGRITAVADAYDVITSKRSYKAPMSVEAARRELVDCAGKQFDPAVVRAFLNVSLGRRWAVGPLAVFSHMPLGNLTTAPAIVSVGTFVSVGAVAVAPLPEPVELAFDDTPATTVEVETAPETIETTIVVTTTPTTIEEPTTEASLVEETTPAVDETTATSDPTSSTTSSTTEAPTSSTGGPSTSAGPTTTAAPTSAAPTTTTTTAPTTTTTTAPTTTTTTAPTTTTTTAPTTTTTTAPTTTTTTAPTTTTTAPPPVGGYFLKNPGSGGDTSAQLFKSLSTNNPDDSTLPNFDTNRDSTAGLSLASTGSGFAEGDTAKIQRFGMDPSSDLDGPTNLRLWVATDANLGGTPVTVRADIADCDWLYQNCTSLAEDTATVTTWVANGFEELIFDFGNMNESFGGTRRLVIRVITEDGHTLHTGFDADTTPSRANLVFS